MVPTRLSLTCAETLSWEAKAEGRLSPWSLQDRRRGSATATSCFPSRSSARWRPISARPRRRRRSAKEAFRKLVSRQPAGVSGAAAAPAPETGRPDPLLPCPLRAFAPVGATFGHFLPRWRADRSAGRCPEGSGPPIGPPTERVHASRGREQTGRVQEGGCQTSCERASYGSTTSNVGIRDRCNVRKPAWSSEALQTCGRPPDCYNDMPCSTTASRAGTNG